MTNQLAWEDIRNLEQIINTGEIDEQGGVLLNRIQLFLTDKQEIVNYNKFLKSYKGE